jgi:hypothetical protein
MSFRDTWLAQRQRRERVLQVLGRRLDRDHVRQSPSSWSGPHETGSDHSRFSRCETPPHLPRCARRYRADSSHASLPRHLDAAGSASKTAGRADNTSTDRLSANCSITKSIVAQYSTGYTALQVTSHVRFRRIGRPSREGSGCSAGANARQQHGTPWASSERVRIGPGFAGAALQRGALRLRPRYWLGPGALSGCSGRGRRICQGLGVSGVVIGSTPATVLNRSGMPRSVLPRGSGAVVRHA